MPTYLSDNNITRRKQLRNMKIYMKYEGIKLPNKVRYIKINGGDLDRRTQKFSRRDLWLRSRIIWYTHNICVTVCYDRGQITIASHWVQISVRSYSVKNSRYLPQALQAIFVILFILFIVKILTFYTASPELQTAQLSQSLNRDKALYLH